MRIGKMKKTRFIITGMHCTSCAANIEKALAKQGGIISFGINSVNGKALAEFDETKIDPKAIIKIIEGLGYKASEVL